MSNTTRWGLDTCGCVFEFENEDADRVEETAKFITKCNIHANDTVRTVITENKGKNRAMAKLVEAGINYQEVKVEFLKKGAGRRLCILTCPTGSPIVEIDGEDKDHTRILFQRR